MAESSRHPQNAADSSRSYPHGNQATDSADVSRVHTLLSNERRRHAIDLIDTHDELSFRELAERIAAREHELTRNELTRREYRNTYVALYQTHIPKLEEAAYLDWNLDSDTVTATAETRQVREVMTAVASSDLLRGEDSQATLTVENIVNWVTGQ